MTDIKGPIDTDDTAREGERSLMNRPVFLSSAIGTLAVTVWAVVAPQHAESTLGEVVGWVSSWLGWYYILLATVVLVFVIFIGASRYGKVRLGAEHSRPEFSTLAWASMLFAAGIGTDIMFYAVYEPAVQYTAPPVADPGSLEAEREATVWALFHYGITGWGMYALMGLALGYFAYRMNLPLAVRSALYPLLGKRINGVIGHTVDTAAVLGTIFGVATSLGIGVVGLNVGLEELFGISQGLPAQMSLLVLAVVIATISAVSGVDKGIKRLSQLNVILAICLALWILVTGRTAFLLNALVQNVGDYVRLFPDMTLNTFAYTGTTDPLWMSYWTLFFWAWWVAWASFVGLFLARISRGRTIREFVAGTLIIPFTYVVMWVSIFGNSALAEIKAGNSAFESIATASPEGGFYALLAEHPGYMFVAGLATFVGLLFYVTSADSGALVMANLSSRLPTAHHDGGRRVRIFWAFATGALTAAILAVGGIFALTNATVIMGLPFSIVMIAVMIGLYRALRIEAHLVDSREGAQPGHLSGRSAGDVAGKGVPWQARLRRVMVFPSRKRAAEFLDETAMPALEEVAAEIAAQGCAATTARVEVGGSPIPAAELHVDVGDDHAFYYRIVHREVPIPAYGGWAPRGDDVYSRLEVHLYNGGQGYDVLGYNHTQLIDDVLDQYERHLEFLRLHESSR